MSSVEPVAVTQSLKHLTNEVQLDEVDAPTQALVILPSESDGSMFALPSTSDDVHIQAFLNSREPMVP